MKTVGCLFLFPALIILSCVYNSDYPLSNSTPVIVSHSSIEKNLIYPDSVVCTLSVSDLNDKALSLAALSCHTSEVDSSVPDTVSWPGQYFQLDQTYNTKHILLSLKTNLLGLYSGTLICSDHCHAEAAIPYEIQKMFYESFNSGFSLDKNWSRDGKNDSTIQFDYFTEPKLLFIFSPVPHDSCSLLSTGITSRFYLSGDFHTTIDFKLRDEMTDGFEIAFYVSTSSDTAKWSGDQAGIFIKGSQGHLRLECKSINLQSYSNEITAYSGELGISRNGSQLDYFFHDGNPQVTPAPMISHDFSSDSVFVHIRMHVDNRLRYRHCLWNDFYALKGRINY